MKKITIIGLFAFGFTACNKNIDRLNLDPKGAVSVPATALFLAGEKNLVDAYTSTSVSSAPFRVLAQTWSEHTYVYEAQYKLSTYNAPSGWWANLYTGVLNNLTEAKKLFPQSISDPARLKNSVIITDILQVYTYHLLVNTYGNIPYSQALNGSIPFPVYDDAKTITMDLLHRLDTCIAGLNTTAGAMGAADQIYNGDVSKWKKFAGTLKLKIAMLIADKDLAKATAKANEAVATGVLQQNGVYTASIAQTENALLRYQSSPTLNTNPVWQALVNSGRHDFGPANTLVDKMVNLNDPRLPLYFTSYPAPGTYKGLVPGEGNGYGNFSDFAAPLYNAALPGVLLDVAETEFLLAEACARGISLASSIGGNTAESHYNAGVTASIVYWGGTVAQAQAYLAQPSVAYSTAPGTWQQKIATQEWIAYWNRGWDAWTTVRRFGFPVLTPPVGAVGSLPVRFTYPSAEQSANSLNNQTAAAAMGGDKVSTKLWWML